MMPPRPSMNYGNRNGQQDQWDPQSLGLIPMVIDRKSVV